STDLSANLQQLFGTTRLAPFGSLSATICTPSGTQGNRTYTISGSAETGLTVSATATVNFTAASSSPAPVTVTPASVTLVGQDARAALQLQSTAAWALAGPPG